MYVVMQPCQRTIPAIRKTAVKTAKNAAKKLGQISFDVKPNKLVSEPKQNASKILCGSGGSSGSYYSLGSCDDSIIVDLYGC